MIFFIWKKKELARNAGNAGAHGWRSAGAGASKKRRRRNAWWLWFSAVTRTVPLAFAVSHWEVSLGPRTPGTPYES